jgi:hypothetical protein
MDDFIRKLASLLNPPSATAHPLTRQEGPRYRPEDNPLPLPAPITRRVLMITHNPILRTQGGKTLEQYFRWNNADALAQGYSDDVREISFGYANYQIVERIVVDGYPLKRDGYRYTEASYLQAWQMRQFHQPDGVDYHALEQEFHWIERVNRSEIDEVWLFGHPYGGYWESHMAGPGAFWCNSAPMERTSHARRKFVIMGFNFERGVGEMLEDLGHRAESTLYKVFEKTRGEANLFERFTRYEKRHPGQAEVGNVHFAPNSTRDYDWGNPTPVLSRCDNWHRFPNLEGELRVVTCADWGDGDIRRHHKWWMRHFPHYEGQRDGIAWNWWKYIIDPNTVE